MSAVMIRSVANVESTTGARLKRQCLPEILIGAERVPNFGLVARNSHCESLTEESRTINHARIRVLSVDNHSLLREGVATIINDQSDMLVVAQASDGREAIQQFRAHRPDITLL